MGRRAQILTQLKDHFERRLELMRETFPRNPARCAELIRAEALRLNERLLRATLGSAHYEVSVFWGANEPEIVSYYDSSGAILPRSHDARKANPTYYRENGYAVVDLLDSRATGVKIFSTTRMGGYALVNSQQEDLIGSSLLYCFAPTIPAALVWVSDHERVFRDDCKWLPTLAETIGLAFMAETHRVTSVGSRQTATKNNYAAPGRLQPPPPTQTGNDKLERREVLDDLVAAIEELRDSMLLEDFAIAEKGVGGRYLNRIREMEIARDENSEAAFDLSILRAKTSFGAGLLEALRPLTQDHRKRIAQHLFIHEIFHYDQRVQSTNYREIGRAGVALEAIDYHADAFAFETLARWALREGGRRAQRRANSVVAEFIESALEGMRAFDRSEQGERLTLLYERRLRRYLTWALQLARSHTLRERDALDRQFTDVSELFRPRLIVELAPVVGELDGQYDKVVIEPTKAAELFVVIDGRLLRTQAGPSLKPGDLVDAVRNFQFDAIGKAMDFIVHEYGNDLAPWLLGSLDGPFGAATQTK